MLPPSVEDIDTALAISDLADNDTAQLRRLEGALLTMGTSERTVSASDIVKYLDISSTTVRDIFRQLESADAIAKSEPSTAPERVGYECNQNRCVELIETAVIATAVLESHRERRQPVPTVQPVVTLPSDPEFTNNDPQDFGFDWLMPSISSEINQSSNEITILMPFFEQDGFDRIQPDIAAALERDVKVNIVSRYLLDTDSNNYEVLSTFVTRLENEGVPVSDLHLFEYAEKASTGDQHRVRQNGVPPDFTLHAKVMVFDDRSVYIGSANITDYGFEQYLEIGVILQGPPVSRYRELSEFLMDSDSAEKVSLFE